MAEPVSRAIILGIPIDAVTMRQAIDRLLQFLTDGRQHHVMTPNSEMLVEAAGNASFRDVLLSSDFNLPDSVGLLKAARWTGQTLPERVAGVDLVTNLCRELSADHQVFLLGAAPGIAGRAAEKLLSKNPSLKIVGTHAGSPLTSDAAAIVRTINDVQPHVLLVAFGSPAQDLWIVAHLDAMPSVRVAMGVGGTLDFLAGDVKRAPHFFRSLGLEWVWRLMLQPWRFKRIWTAVIVFPWMVLTRRAPR
ncbi:MAG: N-acetylglucosaminyldiphosphoundecaprenol [Candidatus Peregrinibacteria bacterium Greene0416_19]|nr:MAG: N-acetylglucosaminyldiphosphoundecaprenol [Candidatus Peregrinibacteria bacterium Greene0416_19]